MKLMPYNDLFSLWDLNVSSSINDVSYDILEKSDSVVLEMAVPGLSKDDLNISFSKGTLTISSNETDLKRSKLSPKKISKSFKLYKAVDETKIFAKCENGILRVDLPLDNVGKPSMIKIE